MPSDKEPVFDLKNPASAAALRASMGRALKSRPKAGEVLGPDGKPVAPVEMKELKPYELAPGDEAAGDHWDTIRRTEDGSMISFTCFREEVSYNSCVTREGLCDLMIPENMHWRQVSAKLGEILKTARANFGEDWGK